MEKLVAKYKIELETPIIVKRSEKRKPYYEFNVDAFNLTLELTTSGIAKSKRKGEKYYRADGKS